MKKTYQRYTREFKIEAVRMAEQSNETMRQVARDLNIRPNQLYKWRKELATKSNEAFPGKGCAMGEGAELRQLRAENERLKQEVEILKKAAVYFARDAG